MKSFGEKIRELREERDISLRELAKRLELSAPFISDIELGRRYPSKKVMQQLADALGVKPEELESYDSRPPIEEVRQHVKDNPAFGFALRKLMDKKVDTNELLRFIEKESGKKNK
jgi:transcriptional regulator with XRE-family HTH domain